MYLEYISVQYFLGGGLLTSERNMFLLRDVYIGIVILFVELGSHENVLSLFGLGGTTS